MEKDGGIKKGMYLKVNDVKTFVVHADCPVYATNEYILTTTTTTMTLKHSKENFSVSQE